MTRICLTPAVSGTGGMVSFRNKLTAGLEGRGILVTTDLSDPSLDAVLVIGGTRQLSRLRQVKQRGIRLVQRLDGINWLQRKRFTGLRHFIRAEVGNFLMNTIRTSLANHIVYQSKFAQGWWQDWYGVAKSPASVIYNGVDLNCYSPSGNSKRPGEVHRLLVVEGNLGGGYDAGLENAVALAETLHTEHGLPMEVMVVGQVAAELNARWNQRSNIPILWAGVQPGDKIPEIDRSAHLLFAADLHPACPNSVIEALACGLPVAAFATGSIRELVPDDAGAISPYGSDPWKLEKPDFHSLAQNAARVLIDPEPFRTAARMQAERLFSLETMVELYVSALLTGVS